VRLIERLASPQKALTFGGTGGTFRLPSFWANEGAEDQESLPCNFEGYSSGAYKSSGPVFACMLVRQLVFSEARFQFQRMVGGRPADLFGTPGLSLLERPWPNGTTGDLLSRMEQDGSLAGNFFATVVNDKYGQRIRRLRPDWVTIVTGSASGDPAALDARVVGYLYHPKGNVDPSNTTLLSTDKVAHWSPIPDPDAQWRGMSWLTPVIREIKGDLAASEHKLKYFKNGATGGIAISYDASVTPASIERFAELFKQTHAGTDNAYKTYHFGGGADVTTIGADLKQLDFKVTQGAGETRIAAASGVGAVIAQLSEGLQGSSLNAGNFNAAKRRFTDGTMRPLWRSASSALETLIVPPSGSRLWYDTRDVAFLQEDQKDEAEIQSANAATIRALVDAGYQPDAVVQAVMANDLRSLIGAHTGLYSVQLQSPSSGEVNQ
jgi:phage portal protein BeeE